MILSRLYTHRVKVKSGYLSVSLVMQRSVWEEKSVFFVYVRSCHYPLSLTSFNHIIFFSSFVYISWCVCVYVYVAFLLAFIMLKIHNLAYILYEMASGLYNIRSWVFLIQMDGFGCCAECVLVQKIASTGFWRKLWRLKLL